MASVAMDQVHNARSFESDQAKWLTSCTCYEDAHDRSRPILKDRDGGLPDVG
jgi:hypothetical protein